MDSRIIANIVDSNIEQKKQKMLQYNIAKVQKFWDEIGTKLKNGVGDPLDESIKEIIKDKLLAKFSCDDHGVDTDGILDEFNLKLKRRTLKYCFDDNDDWDEDDGYKF